MTSGHLHYLLDTAHPCFGLNSKGGRYYTKAWTRIIGDHLCVSLSELKKIYLESQGRLRITSGYCDEMCDIFHVDEK